MQLKKEYIILALPLIVFLAIIVFFFVVNTSQKKVVENIPPTPTPISQSKPLVPYKPGSFDRMVQLETNRQQLSATDMAIRKNLIAQADSNTGKIYAAPSFSIKYVEPFDIFQAGLLTTDLDSGRRDAINWLKSQGLSDQGICNLPFSFYLPYQTAIQFQGKNVTLNPLPDGC